MRFCATRTAPLQVAVLTVVGLCLFACERVAERAPPSSLRLVDRVDQAEFESAIDLTDLERLDRIGVHRLECQPLPAPDSPELRRVEGAWIEALVQELPTERGGASNGSGGERAAGLWLTAGQALLRVFDVEPYREYDVRALVDAREASGLALLALPLDRRPSEAELADPDWLLASMAASLGTVHSLQPREPVAGRLEEHGVWFKGGEKTRALLFGAATRGGAVGLDRICLFERSPFVAQLLRHRPLFGSVHLRRVEVGQDFRESIVFAAPGAVRFRVDLPGKDSRFSAVVAGLEELLTPSLRVEVEGREVAAGEGVARTSIDLAAVSLPDSPSRWIDLDLDLSALSGPVDLTIRVAPSDPTFDRICGVAIGNPILSFGASEPVVAPDVVLVSLDTLRADRVGAVREGASLTPHLDRLAGRARRFLVASAPAAYTLPSHASLFTGELPDRHGAIGPGRRLAAEKIALAERFRAAGYETIALTGGGYLHPDLGFADGFERYGTLDPAYDPSWWRPPSTADLRRQVAQMPSPRWSRDALLDLLDRPVRDRPLFLFVHTYAAHNYVAPESDLRAVGLDPTRLESGLGARSLVEFCRHASITEGGSEAARQIERLYDASVRVADRLLGEVVSALARAKRLDDTLLVVVSDHGEELFERGRFGHGFSVYEEMIRVPIWFSGPGVTPGVSDRVVSLIDVTPTLLELTGLPDPGRFDGESLLPLLKGGGRFRIPALAVADDREGRRVRALRGERWKLIDAASEGGGTGLFDLAADPHERSDRAVLEAKLAQRLLTLLRERVERAEAARSNGVELEMSEPLQRALRELGYLDG